MLGSFGIIGWFVYHDQDPWQASQFLKELPCRFLAAGGVGIGSYRCRLCCGQMAASPVVGIAASSREKSEGVAGPSGQR